MTLFRIAVFRKGLVGLLPRLVRAILGIERRAEGLSREAGLLFVKAAKRHAPVGRYFDESGTPVESTALRHKPHKRLRDSIRLGPTSTLAGGRGLIGWETAIVMAPHGKFTLKGVRPHMIFPRREKGALAFFWEGLPEGAVLAEKVRVINRTGTGGFVLTFHVHHPGFPPNRWDLKAWFEVKDRIWQMMKEAGYDFVVAVGGKR